MPARRLRPAALALAVAAVFTSLPTASQNVLPVHKADVVGTSSSSLNAAGSRLTVTTTNGAGANHSAINWQSFSIGAGNAVRFEQPNPASMSINRVVTNTPSQIYGTLSSNGKLVLVNQSGITVGAGAVVDTAGFTASVLGMSDADAAAGRLRFNADGLGQATGALRVEGNVIARGGDVVLIAPSVKVAQTAVVEAQGGDVMLAAGQRVEVTGRGLEGIRLEVQAPSDEAINLGKLKGDAVGIFAGTLRHSNLNQATTASIEGGKVVLRALDVADVSARINAQRATSAGTSGGEVTIAARYAIVNGAIDASGGQAGAGTQGGSVSIDAQAVVQSGTIDVSGGAGGGIVLVRGTQGVIQTAGAQITADAAQGAGGTVSIQGGDVMTSATVSASGATHGGRIDVTGPNIRLQAAKMTADGELDGGSILLGGGKHGNDPLLPNSQYLYVNGATALSARSRRAGIGGDVVLWSDGTTRFFGGIDARGAGTGNRGGWVEVSGKTAVQFDGLVHASGGPGGTNGTLLLDPKNITIGPAAGQLGIIELADPNHEADGSGTFGNFIFDLASNRVLVTDSTDNLGGANAGAIYVFDKTTGTLLTALTGARANDQVGAAYNSVYGTGSVVFKSNAWSGADNVGAYTFFNGGTAASLPASGTLSSANSLVGIQAGDLATSYLTMAPSGRHVLIAPDYDGGKGAVATFAETGFTGTLSSATALMGSTGGAATGDHVGSGGTLNINGGLLVLSPGWSGGKGAITPIDTTVALSGNVSGLNSAVGETAGDHVGGDPYGIYRFDSGRLMLFSQDWGGGKGAFTVFDSVSQVKGVVNAANSLVGTRATVGTVAGDGGGFTIQGCDSYTCGTSYADFFLITNPNWSDSATASTNAGAVTVIRDADQAAQSHGAISAANSLVGSAGDEIGSGGVTLFGANGYLLVNSPSFQSSLGAVTYVSIASPPTGTVGATNSITGINPYDLSGASFTAMPSGNNLLMIAPDYSADPSTPSVGAMAVLAPGAAGTLSTANALMGSTPGDHIGGGGGGLDETDGYYWVLKSPNWTGTNGPGTGAVTIFDPYGTVPVGNISGGSNSWIGENAGDRVGEDLIFKRFSNGRAVMVNPHWGADTLSYGKGAITLLDNVAHGTVSATNSLVGGTAGNSSSLADGPGIVLQTFSSDGYQTYDGYDTHLIVASNPAWSNHKGFVTMLDEGQSALPSPGPISPSNSLVGGTDNDNVGAEIGAIPGSTSGTLVIRSPGWQGGSPGSAFGAYTFAHLTPGGLASGVLSSANSLVGEFAGDLTQSSQTSLYVGGYYSGPTLGMYGIATDHALLVASDYSGGKGAILNIDLAGTLPTGVLNSTNALVGKAVGDNLGSGGVQMLYYVDYGTALVYSPNASVVSGSTLLSGAGAITAIDTSATSPRGYVTAANSLVGSHAGDAVGSNGYDDMVEIGNGALAFFTASYDGGVGALTLKAGASAVTGQVSASDSLVGNAAGDFAGYSTALRGSNLYTYLPNMTVGGNADAGAIIRLDTTAASPAGAVDASNALVGAHANDRVGSTAISFYSDGMVVTTPDWDGGKGSILFGSEATALTGYANASANGFSIQGINSGDLAAYSLLGYSGGKRVLVAPHYDAGRGAIANISFATPLTGGTLNSTNALMGAAAGDQLGSSGTASFAGTGAGAGWVVGSESFSSGKGALTFSDANGIFTTGVVSSANSLVGLADGDRIGRNTGGGNLFEFTNGKLLVISNYWGSGSTTAATGKGALTLLQSPYQASGTVSSANSLVGTAVGDLSQGLTMTPYDNNGGTYYYGTRTRMVVSKAAYNGGRGMVTLIDSLLATSPAGAIDETNALVGTNPGDMVGSNVSIDSSGIKVYSPNWSGDTGAVTFSSLSSLPHGAVSAANSLVGAQSGDRLGSNYFSLLYGGTTLYTYSNTLGGNKGGVVFVPAAGTTGVLSAANTVYGKEAGGAYPYVQQEAGSSVVRIAFSNGSGGVVYVDPSQLGSAAAAGTTPPQSFGDAPGSDVTITPEAITAMTNAGTDVHLQANNDIAVNAPIVTVVSAANNGGAGTLLLEAGRSILLNANIDTGGGDLGLLANSRNADANYRDAGAGGIYMSPAASITLGGGAMVARVDVGAAGAQGGMIELGAISSDRGLLVQNQSTSDGTGIAQLSGTVWDVQKLGLQTSASSANIGSQDQPIAFTGDEMAIRTEGGSANIHHLGNALYFSTEPGGEGGGDGAAVLSSDPGFRGIGLAGQGVLNLRSEGDIYLVAGMAPVFLNAATTAIAARSLSLQGGTEPGAYAAVVSRTGDMVLDIASLSLRAGSAPNADAVILAPNAEALSRRFGSGYLGGDPLSNSTTDTGFGSVTVATSPIQQQLVADQNFLTDFLDRYNDELLRQKRRGRSDIVLEESCR